MRIALIDNMNNNFFALTRYFRDLGLDAELFLIPNRTLKHFDPEQDTWMDISNVSWIKQFPISYSPINYFLPIGIKLRSILNKYDRIVACGKSIGLLHKARIKVDLFIPYGSDLIHDPFLTDSKSKNTSFNTLARNKALSLSSSCQYNGIKNVGTIFSNKSWKVAQDALDKIGRDAINLPRVMIYKETIPDAIEKKYLWVTEHDFVVFSPTRHLWKTNAEPLPDFDIYGGAKRNDKLINAFAKVVSTQKYKNPLLILSKYGDDVTHSENLIDKMKIKGNVRWLPLLPRKELVSIMRKSTFVADQFREGMCATSAGTTNEALANGVPVITNIDGAIFDKNDPYFGCPILEALSTEDIYMYFSDYNLNKNKYNQIRKDSEKWFDDNLGIGLAKKYLQILDVNTNINFK